MREQGLHCEGLHLESDVKRLTLGNENRMNKGNTAIIVSGRSIPLLHYNRYISLINSIIFIA